MAGDRGLWSAGFPDFQDVYKRQQYEMELGDKKNCADIIKQFENARRFLYDESASLYIHAYDAVSYTHLGLKCTSVHPV